MADKKKKYGSSVHAVGSRRVLPAESASLSRTTARKGVQADSSATVTGKDKSRKPSEVKNLSPKAKAGKIDIKAPKAPAKKTRSERKAAKHQERASKKQLRITRKDRLKSKSKKLGDKAKLYEGTKKGDRLAKRAKRKSERASGERRSAFATGLHKVGRAAFGVTAALGGSDAGLRKAEGKKSFWKNAAHKKKKKE